MLFNLSSSDGFGDVVCDDLDFLFDDQISNWQYFGSSFAIISHTMIGVVQVTIAIKWEVIYGHSNGIFDQDAF